MWRCARFGSWADFLRSKYIDSLLCKLSHLIPEQLSAFADNLNFSQEFIAIIYEWFESHKMPLYINKNVALHCGAKNSKRQYKLCNSIMPTVLQFKNVGVLRSERRPYGEHIEILSASCHSSVGMLKRVFKSHDVDLLCTALKTNVISTIIYVSPAWNSLAKQNIVPLKRVQRRFAKLIPNFKYLTYEQCLKFLNILSLEDCRHTADMVFVYRCLHNLCDVTLVDIGLGLLQYNERSGKLRLYQPCHKNQNVSMLFKFRASQP